MDWLTRVRNAEKTSIVQDGKRKIHYKFQDGEEMAEEYTLDYNSIVRRAWKNQNSLSKKNKWEIEIGDPELDISTFDSIGIRENSNSPYIVKRVTKNILEWRIRNLSYPVEVYSVTADPDNKTIIVKTSNKKYYKKINVPELERANIVPVQKNIEYAYKFGTLIITYKKPTEVLKMDREILEELRNVRSLQDDGELPCSPS